MLYKKAAKKQLKILKKFIRLSTDCWDIPVDKLVENALGPSGSKI